MSVFVMMVVSTTAIPSAAFLMILMVQQPSLGFIDDTIYLLKEGFESGSLPAGWSVIDSDGDGYNWDASYPSNNFMTHTGAGVIASASFQ